MTKEEKLLLEKGVVIDQSIVDYFIHHYYHMEHERYIPEVVLNLEFDLNGDLGKSTVRKELETYRNRVEKLARCFIDVTREIPQDKERA